MKSSKTFAQEINELIISIFEKYSKSVIYGQNIIAGSRISGLGSNLENIKNALVFNSTNTENALMGLGLGCTLKACPSLYLMKQHDFALLGLDQLVNTYNLIRNGRMKAPFVVGMVVVDNGYEGPQSNLNNIDDFASITKGNIHYLNTIENIETLKQSGFTNDLHFLVISQKNLKTLSTQNISTKIDENSHCSIYRFNRNLEKNINSLIIYSSSNSVFHEDFIEELSHVPTDIAILNKINKNIDSFDYEIFRKYKYFYLFSSTKSLNKILYLFQKALVNMGKKVETQFQSIRVDWTEVNDDNFEIDLKKLQKFIIKSKNEI